MTGNVWEWTDTAYGPDHARDYGSSGYDPQQPGIEVKTLKGGSFHVLIITVSVFARLLGRPKMSL